MFTVMKLALALVALSISLPIKAAPASELRNVGAMSNSDDLDMTKLPAASKRGAPRFSCGQYKFKDGTVQEFYSQVWAGLPAEFMICRLFKYEFGDKKGQGGTMVAAKVDLGCTCFFYEMPCNPNSGRAETWKGWLGWQNYVTTDKPFRGWYCFEQS
ncbi:hypothetical protein SVAN01_11462 [Stagonosporopsis vannaccii]|nr:hypothetical protein SVAN01_11462 [Stagonosporopsis vannaccii]